MKVRLGTRGSQLALAQAHAVRSRLEAHGHAVEQLVVRTTGDRLQDVRVGESGGKRLFVKELEEALLRNDIDVAVHSAKDLPADVPAGLVLAAALPREDPRDAIVLPDSAGAAGLAAVFSRLAEQPARRVGTGSVRRIAQLTPQMPQARFEAIRGNVDTRLRKLDAGEFDALVLACAGLRRLGLQARISVALPLERCVPAPGQGIVSIQARQDDVPVLAALAAIHDEAAGVALGAERALVHALGGDCQVPLGGLARLNGGGVEIDAVVCSLDGRTVIRRQTRGSIGQADVAAKRLADELLAAGAGEILAKVRRR